MFQAKSQRTGLEEEDVCKVQESETTGRVRWCFARKSWVVTHHDAAGKRLEGIKGLCIARTDCLGNALKLDDFKKLPMDAFTSAKVLWNKLDKSESPRFSEQEVSLHREDADERDVETACHTYADLAFTDSPLFVVSTRTAYCMWSARTCAR